MMHDAERRRKIRPALLSLLAVLSLLAGLGCSAALAQSIMRSPSLNISSRVPSIDRSMPRIDPNLAGRGVMGLGNNIRFQPSCTAADRDSGNCSGDVTTSSNSRKNGKKAGNSSSDASLASRAITNEIVAEIDGTLSEAQVDALARRHGLRRIESRNFELIGVTIGLFRITGGKTLEAASRQFAQDGSVRSLQPNFRYTLQGESAGAAEGDPAKYPQAELRLPQAHALANGANVTVAVIDSAIDLKHSEFAGVTITPLDALDSKERAHPHGTGVAGAIVSHVRLMGSAPAAHVLAIRAFGTSGKAAESSSYVLLKGLDLAAGHGAQIVNMSFTGPKDAIIGRGLTALAARNIVMVAAAGNAGPKSPPLYPAADANVIAVSATDAKDKLFAASNRGSYIAVAAPGVDLFLPAPDDKYQITSGTSFSCAFVSGVAALMLQRNPALKPQELRAILTRTARDLGPPGPDDQFGAGEADAFAAVSAVVAPGMPVAVAPQKPDTTDVSNTRSIQPAAAENLPAATVAVETPASAELQRNAGKTKPAVP
ncbi:MAG: S8 family serine peptidase [Bradyrhizobium sp.]|jgi:subtilisin family serine protease|uniref:S8 family serine peptidase n=1 Tax=Bradyrhizobium sp. TaxID=376 RepID=UPI003BAE97B2